MKISPVEEFVPEFAVEAFDVAVLPRTPRLDEQRLDSQPREPLPDGFGCLAGTFSPSRRQIRSTRL